MKKINSIQLLYFFDMSWKQVIQTPGDFFFQTNVRRSVYKTLAHMACFRRLSQRRQLASQLPEVPHEQIISHGNGLRIFKAEDHFIPQKYPAIKAGQAIINSIRGRSGMTFKNREFLENFMGPLQLRQYPEFLEFGLDERLLAIVTEYLGELPVLPYIFLWRSEVGHGPLKTSQLYHLDHSDVRQIKLFVFLNDIDQDNGPLVVIPAEPSNKLRKHLGYDWTFKKRRVSDEEMHRWPEAAKEMAIKGKEGTTVLADTSRLFHYGSRVKSGIRYMLVYRYLTISSFLFNPFSSRRPYPLSNLVRPEHSPIQRAVLTGLS